MREQGTRPKRGRERVKRAPLTHRTRRITQRRRVPKERRRTPVMRRASRIMLKHVRAAGRHLITRRQRPARLRILMPARARPMEAAMRKRTLRRGIAPRRKRTRDKSTTRRTHPRHERVPSRSRVHRTASPSKARWSDLRDIENFACTEGCTGVKAKV
jgi:hypothetical protein